MLPPAWQPSCPWSTWPCRNEIHPVDRKMCNFQQSSTPCSVQVNSAHGGCGWMLGKKAQCRRAPGTRGARGVLPPGPFVFRDTRLANGRVALINKGHRCARVRNCKRQVFIISDFLCVLCVRFQRIHTTTTTKAKRFLLSHPPTQDGKEDGEEERGHGRGHGRGR